MRQCVVRPFVESAIEGTASRPMYRHQPTTPDLYTQGSESQPRISIQTQWLNRFPERHSTTSGRGALVPAEAEPRPVNNPLFQRAVPIGADIYHSQFLALRSAMEQSDPSQPQPFCAAAVSGCSNHHDVKAQCRRKYIFSDQADQLIREAYLSPRDGRGMSSIHLLAKRLGMPHWALKKRARELGLARTKELPWSEAELSILSRYAWMSDERIRLKLKAAGYTRTVTGIHLKLKRMRFKRDGSFYSANSLAQALGIDPHAVTRWIKSGHLTAKFRGTARTEQQNGDSYLIQEKDVRRFILEHPTDIDLRKVDQLWFLDLVTNGLVRAA